MSLKGIFFLLPTAAVLLAVEARAQDPIGVRYEAKIADAIGGFSGSLLDEDRFGSSMTTIGDLDGDGIEDLAVGAGRAGDADRGAVWILFLDAQDQVKSHYLIDEVSTPALGLVDGDFFGTGVCDVGDLDGDGYHEIVVGAPGFDGPPPYQNRGGLHVLFLEKTGAVNRSFLFSSATGGIPGWASGDNEQLGWSLATLENFDPAAEATIAAGFCSLNAFYGGAFLVLELDWYAPTTTLSVNYVQRISETAGGASGGGFGGALGLGDLFGLSLAYLGELGGPGVPAIAVGAPKDDDGNQCNMPPVTDPCQMGAVWILFFDSLWQVTSFQKISASTLAGVLEDGDHFGWSVAWLDPFTPEQDRVLLVGARADDDGADAAGAAYLLALDVQPSGGGPQVGVSGVRKISSTEGTFAGQLDASDGFGMSAANFGDRDGDGNTDLLVGFPGNDDGGPERGGFWKIYPGERFAPHLGCDYQGQPCGPTTPFCRNMQGSLVHLEGVPRLGDTVTFGLTSARQCPGLTATFLYVALRRNPVYVQTGCGNPAPGWGWLGTTDPAAPPPHPVPGEVLISVPSSVMIPGPVWFGPPASISLGIPNLPVLVGVKGWVQGVLADPSGNGCGLGCGGAWECWVPLSLTSMLEFTVVP